jgi:ATPase subunit of ABC transporter with duplicated ATPase domains
MMADKRRGTTAPGVAKRSNQSKRRTTRAVSMTARVAVASAGNPAGFTTEVTNMPLRENDTRMNAITAREYFADHPVFENTNTKSDRAPNIAPIGARNVGKVVIRKYAAANAYTGADTWRRKGGMMGGRDGACAGVTGNNGLRVVPRAFIK